MNRDRWERAAAKAAVQHGLVTTSQLRSCGIDSDCLRRAVRAGLLTPVRKGILRLAGVPHSPLEGLMAACLASPGGRAVASYQSAGTLHRLPVVIPALPEVTCADELADQLSGVGGHRSRRLPLTHCTVIDHIPCTTIERTIIDLASRYLRRRHALEALVDDADRRNLCRPAEIERSLDAIGSRGRSGTRQLREILSDRVGGDSPLETRWLRWLRDADLPSPARQYQVVVGHRVLVLDAAWPEKRVALELDGWEPHRTRGSFDRDASKSNVLLGAGWRVVHATSQSAPELVISQIRRLLVA